MTRLRWGLIGCGDIVRKRVASALSSGPRSELRALSRARAELAHEFARAYDARVFSDWRDMLRSDEIDAVYIATPVYLHCEQAVEAALNGKHVLCEKPMALDVSECDRMITACAGARVKLGVAYYRHLYPLVHRIRSLVMEGIIGKPVLACVEAYERFNPQPGSDRYWLLEPEKSGGGPMMDFGCHRIEILLDVLGPIDGVSSMHKNSFFDRRVEDTTVASFDFASGALATLTCTHAAIEPCDSFDLYCTNGSIHVETLNKGSLKLVTQSGVVEEIHAPAPNLHQPIIDDFVDSVLNDRPPAVDGSKGRAVSEILDRIYTR